MQNAYVWYWNELTVLKLGFEVNTDICTLSHNKMLQQAVSHLLLLISLHFPITSSFEHLVPMLLPLLEDSSIFSDTVMVETWYSSF